MIDQNRGGWAKSMANVDVGVTRQWVAGKTKTPYVVRKLRSRNLVSYSAPNEEASGGRAGIANGNIPKLKSHTTFIIVPDRVQPLPRRHDGNNAWTRKPDCALWRSWSMRYLRMIIDDQRYKMLRCRYERKIQR
jgi:hypothetical protein